MDGDRDSNNLVVHSEPDNEDNEEFSSPLGSPNLIDTQTVLYTNQGTPEAIIGLSNAQATGISTNEGNICVSDNTSILEVTDIFKSKGDQRKRVKFNSDNAHFDDTDLWAHDPNENSQDMINAYQKECMVMKIKPIQILLDQLKGVYDLNTPIDTIDLTGVKLENRACEVLEAVLSRVHASTLKLERTNLEDEGIIAICEMVEFYGCACKLLLAHNNRLRPRAWLTIGRTLKKSPFVSTIDVSYCALDEQTLTLLLRAVRANCGLKVLKMEGNNLTGKGTFILMAAMKFNENLQELHLSRNHLGPEDGQHLGNILRTNHTLRVLDVSDNNLQVIGLIRQLFKECSYSTAYTYIILIATSTEMFVEYSSF
jgi:protein phosphatase 1 regulatory subunit 37